ncbi:uncharacterized protein LOC135686281 [Rhopilema esculentum]|uniref:uncharacterized protein LOC135686281 n=1 Tax=Rhopilema esculentum TaxID=499914 RepID=UPI0031DC67B1
MVWAYKWISAKTQKSQIKVYITSIDMSSAFETIRREQLVDIAKKFLDEDEEAIYADDADFLTTSELEKNIITEKIGEILLRDNLKVNNSKTEQTEIFRGDRNTERWRTVKKLGSLLSDTEDIQRRKQLSIASMNRLNHIWIRKDHVSEKLRLKLYRTLVKPVLICEDGPISIDILKDRWRLFGHILRLSDDTPAVKAMRFYFEGSERGFRGRPRETLVTTLNKDITRARAMERSFPLPNIKNNGDFEKIRSTAKDRKEWRRLSEVVCRAAEAETT